MSAEPLCTRPSAETGITERVTSPPEEDRATAVGNTQKKFVKIGRVVAKI